MDQVHFSIQPNLRWSTKTSPIPTKLQQNIFGFADFSYYPYKKSLQKSKVKIIINVTINENEIFALFIMYNKLLYMQSYFSIGIAYAIHCKKLQNDWECKMKITSVNQTVGKVSM